MNYTEVNWSTKTTISKENLATMDNGIKACSVALNSVESEMGKIPQILCGKTLVSPTSDDTSTGDKVTKKEITFPTNTFANTPFVVATAFSGRPDLISVTVNNITNTGFTIYLHHANADVAVEWIAVGSK